MLLRQTEHIDFFVVPYLLNTIFSMIATEQLERLDLGAWNPSRQIPKSIKNLPSSEKAGKKFPGDWVELYPRRNVSGDIPVIRRKMRLK